MFNLKRYLSVGSALVCFLAIPYASAETNTIDSMASVESTDSPIAEFFDKSRANFQKNVYLEGNFGYSTGDAFDDFSSDYFDVTDGGFGFSTNVGYQFTPFFALETGFIYFAPQEVETNWGDKLTQDVYAGHLSAKGILPLADSGFSVFTKLGYAFTYTEVEASGGFADGCTDDEVGGSFLLGFGAAYAINERLAANAQWNRVFAVSNIPGGSDFDMDLFTVGLAYKFLI